VEAEFRFQNRRYGIDVPDVKPYCEDMTQVAGRPLRADARRNRERVLQAAREVFAEQGREAQIDDVAKRAEVGVGTVYRHFPTKEALIDALAAEAFGRMLAVALEQVQRDDDPWDALVTTLWSGAEIMAGDRAVSQLMTEMPSINVDVDMQKQLNEALTTLLSRARDAGTLREDIVLDDVPMLMCGVGMATMKPHCVAGAWRRHVAIVIDGLRASGASGPLPSE
jgi:AcrR family transcriptional regulator